MPNFEVTVTVSIVATSMASAVSVIQERIERDNNTHRNEAYVEEINAKPEKKKR